MNYYSEVEIEEFQIEFRVNIQRRVDHIESDWYFSRRIIEAIIIYFQGSYDQTDEYIHLMESEGVDEPKDVWAIYCDMNDIEHEIDNNPFE